MKPQTCCCHCCKTSLNQYKREFLPCTNCNKIVCRNCFGTKFRAATWEESVKNRKNWLCPSCSGTCICPRCRKRSSPTYSLKISSNGCEEFKRDSSPDTLSELSTPRASPIRIEKFKIRVEKVVFSQLQEMVDREKRCDGNIKEMERLLYIMKREKEDIADERSKLEDLITFGQFKKTPENKTMSNSEKNSTNARWNQLLFGASLAEDTKDNRQYRECEDDSSEKEVDIDTEDSKSFEDNISIFSSV